MSFFCYNSYETYKNVMNELTNEESLSLSKELELIKKFSSNRRAKEELGRVSPYAWTYDKQAKINMDYRYKFYLYFYLISISLMLGSYLLKEGPFKNIPLVIPMILIIGFIGFGIATLASNYKSKKWVWLNLDATKTNKELRVENMWAVFPADIKRQINKRRLFLKTKKRLFQDNYPTSEAGQNAKRRDNTWVQKSIANEEVFAKHSVLEILDLMDVDDRFRHKFSLSGVDKEGNIFIDDTVLEMYLNETAQFIEEDSDFTAMKLLDAFEVSTWFINSTSKNPTKLIRLSKISNKISSLFSSVNLLVVFLFLINLKIGTVHLSFIFKFLTSLTLLAMVLAQLVGSPSTHLLFNNVEKDWIVDYNTKSVPFGKFMKRLNISNILSVILFNALNIALATIIWFI